VAQALPPPRPPVTMTAPAYWKRATRELAACDPVIAALVRRHQGLALASRGDAFQTLARAIVGQQISVKAAQSVWNRFAAALGTVEPGRVLDADPVALRGAGLSARKVEYVGDLARHFHTGLVDAQAWPGLDDEALITSLTAVRGVGRWTAEMFLIFHLARPDVLPVGDVGLQRAVSLSYNRGRAISERRLRTIARAWSPWRSVATWYLWRSLDPIAVEY